MDVGLVTSSTLPRGEVVHTLALAEALVEQGAAVTVYGLGEAFHRRLDPRVRIRLAPAPECGDADARVLAGIDALCDIVVCGLHDVLHTQDWVAANAVPGAVRSVHHVETFTSHVLSVCHARGIVEPPARVCPSPAIAEHLRDAWDVDATVIATGVDAGRFAAAGPGEWRTVLGGDPLVLAVGDIEPRKGTLELIEAIAALGFRRPGTRLAIAGGDTAPTHRAYRKRVVARCRQLGVRPIMLGPLPEAELPSLVAACDALVLPSTTAGSGVAALEALAARRPVVLSALPDFRERFGATVRYGQGPLGLAAALDAALGQPLDSEPGAALAETHTWSRAAQAHLALYANHVSPAAAVTAA